MIRSVQALGITALAVSLLACETDQAPSQDSEWKRTTRQKVRRPERPPPRLDVLVGGEALPKYIVDDVTYVEGTEGVEYQVKVTVPGGERFEAQLWVDGIDTINVDVADNGGLIGSDSMTFQGFRVNRREVEAFEFTSAENSVADRIGLNKRIGEIRVEIHWEDPDYEYPLYAHKSLSWFGKDESGRELGTRGGRRIESPIGFGTPFHRNPADPPVTLVLHYDSRAGLKARGVEVP